MTPEGRETKLGRLGLKREEREEKGAGRDLKNRYKKKKKKVHGADVERETGGAREKKRKGRYLSARKDSMTSDQKEEKKKLRDRRQKETNTPQLVGEKKKGSVSS